MKKIGLKTAFIFCAVLLLNTGLLSSLYQNTWAAHEDGYFAHVAERLLQGEKLYRDVESRHAGYIHLVNAAAMSVLGPTTAAPRVPVVLLTLLQSAVLFFLFLPNGLLAAVLVSLITTILGYLQCLTPSTHWYCLFLLILMVASLFKLPKNHALRIPLLGFLLGLIILFRQLTGFFAGAGLLCYLFTEDLPEEKKGTPTLPRLLLLLSAGVLFLNFRETFEINGFLLLGLWPCFLMLWAFFHTRLSNQETFALCLKLGLGLLIAFLPLFIYLAVNQAFFLWMDDVIIRSSRMLKDTPYETWSSYALYQIGGALQIYRHQGFRLPINGLYWFLLPLLSFLNGLLVFLILLKRKALSSQEALHMMTVFYSIVSYTLQIPIYLYYSASLSLISLLWISKNYFRRLTPVIFTLASFLLITGLYFHAGQPCQRGIKGMREGERQGLFESEQLSKLGLKIHAPEKQAYEDLIGYIKTKTSAEDSLFVFPNNPEVYFLADRKILFVLLLPPPHFRARKT